jgi:hypothetical protein
MKTETGAPDFAEGSGYPSKGAKIGPAWSLVWIMMEDGEWHRSNDLAEACCAMVVPKTVRALLWQAERAKLIEKEIRTVSGGARKFPIRSAWYRRVDA